MGGGWKKIKPELALAAALQHIGEPRLGLGWWWDRVDFPTRFLGLSGQIGFCGVSTSEAFWARDHQPHGPPHLPWLSQSAMGKVERKSPWACAEVSKGQGPSLLASLGLLVRTCHPPGDEDFSKSVSSNFSNSRARLDLTLLPFQPSPAGPGQLRSGRSPVSSEWVGLTLQDPRGILGACQRLGTHLGRELHALGNFPKRSRGRF